MIIMSMREKIKSKAGKIFMYVIFIGLFGGLGLSRLFMSKFMDADSVVIINSIPVAQDIYNVKLKQEEQTTAEYRAKYGKNADMVMKIMGITNDPQKIALRSVIYDALLESFRDEMRFYLSPDYVMIKLSDPYFIMQELRQQFPLEQIQNPIAFYQMLQQTEYFPQIDSKMKLDLKNDFMFSMIRSGMYIPSFAMQQIVKDKNASKKFSVQKFSLAFFADQAKKNVATAEQLKAFFDEQNILSKRYWMQEKRTATVWTFNPKDYGITVTEKEIEDFYTKNKTTRFIDVKAQVKIREIVLPLDKKNPELSAQEARKIYEEVSKNPSSFVTFVKNHSTKKSSKDKDGIVEFFSKSIENPSEYEKVAFRLKADGDISPVIKLEDSLVILQRVARKEPTYKSLTQVKSDIQRLLVEQKFKSVFAKDVSPLIHHADAQALEQFVKTHQGILSEKQLQVRSDNPSVFEQKLFSVRKENGMVGFIDEGKGILLKVTALDRPQSASFKTVKDQVAQDYYEQKGRGLMQEAMQKSKKTAFEQKKLTPTLGATISSTDWIKASDNSKIQDLTSKQGYPYGFMAIDIVGGALLEVGNSEGVVILLEGIQELKELPLEEKKQLLTSIYTDLNKLYSQGFIASLYRDATIKVNEDLARTIERR